jgi:hypothetical protein
MMFMRPALPFTSETATQTVRLAEDSWNTREPAKVVSAFAIDTYWRHRAEFAVGRDAAEALLARKWAQEFEYRLIEELWAFGPDRIAVRFVYEYHNDSNYWFRAYGSENWEFNPDGRIARRHASINERPICEFQRKLRWPLGRRPDDHPSLSELDF